jgi:ribosomal protein S18 acetylase RimI-like enzyme
VSLVEHSPRTGTIWSGVVSARVRPWPHSDHKAFLVINGAHGPEMQLPDEPILNTWIQTISSWGYRSVRTSALAPGASLPLERLGFSISQSLVLLQKSHDKSDPHLATTHPIHSVRPLPLLARPRRATIDAILVVDAAAFGTEWSLDTATFEEALKATRHWRMFISRSEKGLNGFVLAGVTQSHGFIQRLAVHPNAQREGVASALLASALNWTQSRRCTSTVVNTDHNNEAALALYRKFGFAALDYGLSVLEKTLP